MDHRAKHHPPTDQSVIDHHQAVRQATSDFLELVESIGEPSRERSLACTKIEEAMMWANAHIARNQ